VGGEFVGFAVTGVGARRRGFGAEGPVGVSDLRLYFPPNVITFPSRNTMSRSVCRWMLLSAIVK
jgi:hypothetical protein